MISFARPYRAAFASRFQLMLQYRAAAVAGFVTQCWWGSIKVMILAAFYEAAPAAAAAPFTLQHAITYTWLAQALWSLLPWMGDPEVSLAVRNGAIAFDRLRPVDAYTFWYVRAAGWLAARAVPRATMMLLFAGVLLPALGQDQWAWQPPVSIMAGLLFTCSIGLAVLLCSAIVMLINIAVVASLHDRGINVLMAPLVVVFSGNLLPLALYPPWLQTALLAQPFAGLLDIPVRIYFANLSGCAALAGISLQLFWLAVLVLCGRSALRRAMRRLEVQGG